MAFDGQPITQVTNAQVSPGAAPGTAPAVAGSNPGQWRTQEDLDLARRRAFLDSSDSAAGVKAVRGLLSDEARNRGIDISGGGSIPAIRFLEQELAKSNANRNGQTSTAPVGNLPAAGQEVWKQMAFDGQPITQVTGTQVPANGVGGQQPVLQVSPEQRQAIQAAGDAAGRVAFAPGAVMPQAKYGSGAVPSLVAPPANANEIANAGNAAGNRAFGSRGQQVTMNNYMQGWVADNARASQVPLDRPVSWQNAQMSITAPRQEPGREGMLAAFGALGEQPPTTPGEAVLAVGAGNAYGTRGGQFKPGNTVNLGEIPADKLPPRNSTGYYSGAAIGELRGYNWGGNPGNYQQMF